jgi:antitoxin (DNA-binding transcriptional repressor) of toxin-antitoxin stability system
MRSGDLKMLKNKLFKYLQFTGGRESVLVTDRDRVVAELVPPCPTLTDVRLTDAVRQGWLTPAVRVGTGPPPRKPVAPFRDLIEELGCDRGGH